MWTDSGFPILLPVFQAVPAVQASHARARSQLPGRALAPCTRDSFCAPPPLNYPQNYPLCTRCQMETTRFSALLVVHRGGVLHQLEVPPEPRRPLHAAPPPPPAHPPKRSPTDRAATTRRRKAALRPEKITSFTKCPMPRVGNPGCCPGACGCVAHGPGGWSEAFNQPWLRRVGKT